MVLEKRVFKRSIWVFALCLGFARSSLAADPVIYFTYLFNWNLNHAGAPVDAIPALVEQGYVSLLGVFEKHDRWRTQFFYSGFTSDYLKEHYPDAVERIKQGQADGRYEIGTYTLSHPILNLTPYTSLVKQFKTGMVYDQNAWGLQTYSLFLPEAAWDPTLPQAMAEAGIRWIAIYKDLIPKYQDKLYYPATVFVEGINNTKATVVFATNTIDRGKSVAELKHTLDSLYQDLKAAGIEEHFISLKGDAEFLYFGSRRIVNRTTGAAYKTGDLLPELPAIPAFEEKLTMIENLPYARFMTMGEYLAKHPPTVTIPTEDIALGAEFGRWLQGRGVERTNILTNEARMEVSNASYVIDLAEKMGLEVADARKLLDQAWIQLMFAEGADGRATNPPASRIMYVTEAAVNATKLAQQAADAIGARKRGLFR